MDRALPPVGDVAAAIGLCNESFEQRKRFIALTLDEERLLQQLQPRMHTYSDQLIEAFYDHLMQFDAVADLL